MVNTYPFDPLTPDEILAAVSILRVSKKVQKSMRFVAIQLHEPNKKSVLDYEIDGVCKRQIFFVILDRADGKTYEAVVSITEEKISSFKYIPGVQPSLIVDEFFDCEQIVKNEPQVRAALQKRGVTDFSLVMVEPGSAGYYGDPIELERRLCRSIILIRQDTADNFYAHPVEGLLILVDLNERKVVRVEDHGLIPIPEEQANYTTNSVKEFRQGLKPLNIVQPEGPSFTVDGWKVKWQKWQFRVGFTPREGLVLYTVGYEDNGRVRPIIYRASLAEMTVPYGHPDPGQRYKNAFDVGEYGIGMLTNSLELGCDCLGEIYYFDVVLSDTQGQSYSLPHAVCMHEEDYGLLWKHKDWRTEQTEVRRSRRLVVSSIATLGNYDYGFYWYFYQDGSIEYEIKLTGIVSTGAVFPGEVTRYGTMLNNQLYATNHQHFFCMRLDMMVDGLNNSVIEVHNVSEPMGPDNPFGNAFYPHKTVLRNEQEAQQLIDPLSGRYWQIINPGSRNKVGQPVSYNLIPGENVQTFLHPNAPVLSRAKYMTRHLWVTPYHFAEKFPVGDYPNQHPGGDGLAKWTEKNRSIEDTDVVLWYVMGHNHIPRLEDWPVMPVTTINFHLKPSGFFDQNPALDVPPPDYCHPIHS